MPSMDTFGTRIRSIVITFSHHPKTHAPWFRSLVFAIWVLFVFCCLTEAVIFKKAVAAETPGGTGGGPIAGACQVTVVKSDSGDPFPGAFVMVGSKPGQPFANNYGTTDSSGQITFTDPALVGPQTVTAGAAGYRFFSFLEVNASQVVIPLQPRTPATDTSQVTGSLTSFDGGENNDGKLRAALVIPTLTLEDLMSLDFSSLLSEEVFLTNILGNAIYVPGNIVIPTQTETFVTITKPTYQLSLPTGSVQDLFSLGVEAPVSELSAGTFDLFSVEPIKLGLERGVEISGDIEQNIDMSAPLQDNLTLNTRNTLAGSNLLLVSAGEIKGDANIAPGGSGGLFLMDFKSATGGAPTSTVLGTVNKTGPFSDTRYLAVALAYSDEITDLKNMTGIVDRSAYSPSTLPTLTLESFFTPVQLQPVTDKRFSFSNATQPGISPQPDLNISLLSLVTTVDTVEETDILWTLFGAGASLSFDLPILPPTAPDVLPFPEQTGADDQLVWTQSVFSLGLTAGFDFNQYDMDDFSKYVTHISANTLEFSADPDNDGIHVFQDNCPGVSNLDQTDTDGDGFGNACDDNIYCPACSGDMVFLRNAVFLSTCVGECIATQSLTIGPGVIVKNGAQVTFKSPRVQIQDGAHFEQGAKVTITQP